MHPAGLAVYSLSEYTSQRFGSAAIPYVVQAVRSAVTATAELFVMSFICCAILIHILFSLISYFNCDF